MPSPSELRRQRRLAKTQNKESLWDKANKPLTDLPSRAGRYISEKIDPEHSTTGVRAYTSAFAESLGDTVSSMTSPLSLGLTALTGGAGAVARTATSPAARAAASTTLKTVGGATAAHGGYRVATADSPAEAAGGALEAGLGYLGYRSAPKVTTASKTKTQTPPSPKLEKITDIGSRAEHPGTNPQQVDNLRRATMEEARRYRSNPQSFTPKQAKALADNLVSNIGTPNAHEQAAAIYRTVDPEYVSEVVAPDSPVLTHLRHGPEKVAPMGESLKAELGTVTPARDAGLTARIGEKVRATGLEDVGEFSRGRYFTPESPTAAPPPRAKGERGLGRQQTQKPRMKPFAPKKEAKAKPFTPPVEEAAPPKSSGAIPTQDPNRPFQNTSTASLQSLAKLGNKGAEAELSLREIENNSGWPIGRMKDLASDETGAVGIDVGRTKQYNSYLKDWGKAGKVDDGPPKLGELHQWRDKQYEVGRDHASIDSAIRASFQAGLDPTKFENIASLRLELERVSGGGRRSRSSLAHLAVDEMGAVGKNIRPEFDLEDGLTRVLNRMDDKGETIDEAIEAVTGGNKDFSRRLKLHAQGETSKSIDRLSKLWDDESGKVQIGDVRPFGDRFAPDLSRGLNRADAHTPGFSEKFGNWVNERRASKIEGVLKKKEFLDMDEKGLEGIKEFQRGVRDGRYRDVESYFNTKHSEVDQSGIRVGFKENYLPQLWENSADEVFQAARRLGLKPKFTLESVLENYEKGLSIGLKPKFHNISDLIGWYEQTANKAMADRRFFDYLMENSLILPKGKAPANGTWVSLDPDHFPIQKFQTKGKEFQGVLMAPKEIGEAVNNYLKKAHPILEWTGNVSSLSKNYAMSAGIPGTGVNAHGFNILARNMMSRGVIRGGSEALKYMVRPSTAMKDLEVHLPSAPFAVRHGLTMTTEGFELGQSNLKNLAQNLKLGDKVANNKLLDFHTKYFERPLFHEILPALKLKHFNELFEGFRGQGMGESEAARSAATATNNIYGGINWEAMGRSRDTQNLLRSIFLAPDWFETNYRMGKGLGQALLDPNTPQGKVYGTVAKNIVASYMAANAVNIATSGHAMWDNPPGHTIDIQVGMSGDRVRYVRPFGTAADFLRLPADTLIATFKDQDIGQGFKIAKNRLSMPFSSSISLLTNTDDFGKPITGRDVYGRKIPMSSQVAGVANEIVGPFTPQYVRNPALGAVGRLNAEQTIAGSVESPLRYARPPRPEGRERKRTRSRNR